MGSPTVGDASGAYTPRPISEDFETTMRTVPDEKKNKPTKGVKTADHHESVGEVLKLVDKQLAPHGLEVVEVDTGSDTYEWFIAERGKKP